MEATSWEDSSKLTQNNLETYLAVNSFNSDTEFSKPKLPNQISKVSEEFYSSSVRKPCAAFKSQEFVH
jgi:hypothetical protein